MKYLLQFSILLAFWLLGEALSLLIQPIIVIPGAIVGMILLFIALTTGLLKEDAIKDVSDFLLGNIAFFFVPACVGVLDVLDILKGSAIQLFIIAIISTIITMVSTMIITQILTSFRRHS